MSNIRTLTLGAILSLAISGAAVAAPLIIAQSVSSICRVEADGSVSSVSVLLNGVTRSFYGASLYYHFSPTPTGAMVVLPTPITNDDPVRLAVPAGVYRLIISPITVLIPSSSQSPQYTVTVPSNLTMSKGSRKICRAVLMETGRERPKAN